MNFIKSTIYANSIEESDIIYNITVPKDNHEKVCVKMEATFRFSVTYLAKEKVF